MKKLFTLALSFGFMASAMAQSKVNPNGNNQRMSKPMATTESQRNISAEQGRANLEQAAQIERGGGVVFFENFANGFAGNNLIGPFTFEDSGNNTIWMMATAESPAGFYSNSSEALESTTAANGWVIFDADLFQGGEINATNPAEAVSGYLISPTVNLSSLGSVILEFQQAFRYCCFNDFPLVVEVSNDGGVNWVVYNAAPDFTGGANDAAANPSVTRIDISGSAAGQENVIIRWGWQPIGTSTHSTYYWGIDDILIYENPIQNDIQISYVSTGDIFNDFEYRAIPLELANPADLGGMVVGTIFQNIGVNSQVATFTVEVLAADQTTVLGTASEVFTIVNNANQLNPTDIVDTLFIATNWVPTEIGDYWVRTTISYDGIDDTPANNTAQKKFAVTLDEYGHNDPTINNGNMRPFDGEGTPEVPFGPHGYGSYYSVNVDGSVAYGLSVRFDNTTDTNAPVSVLLLARNVDYNLTDAEFVAGREYDVDNAWTPNGIQSFPEYLPFEVAGELDAGNLYFAGVQVQDEGLLELAIQSTPEIDRDFSTGIWGRNTNDEWLWFFGQGDLTDHSPAIRLIVSERVGVSELNAQSEIQNFVVSPNPANLEARINFSLQGSRYVTYEVRDMSGKLIEWKNAGQFVPGQNTIALDVAKYAVGNYLVNLVIDGERIYSQQMNVTR